MYLKWASHCEFSIQNFIFSRRKFVWVWVGGLAWGRLVNRPNVCGGCFQFSFAQKICNSSTQDMGKIVDFCDFLLRNSVLWSCFWLTGSKVFFVLRFLCLRPPFWGGLRFIHFGVTEEDQGYLGLWDGSPSPKRHTNLDQLDSGMAVHSTDKKKQSKTEATEAPKKRDAPCSTSVFKSGGGQKSLVRSACG